MKWWKRPLIYTVILFVVVVVLSVVVGVYITSNPVEPGPGVLTEEQRFERLGRAATIFMGIGAALIWFPAYTKKKRGDGN